ncbi:alpha/beta fold hydrolase [Elioraea sp.]|jgi:pimeloyl-ACP methyl ester carboxylesterase|uniref:alpha/beta fold hydrolase n=1 Tax=Elioraea sp. TaxID=2185103 RepID=UPI0021DE91A7|nr:alpha/beta hydrolase [Elioraea sp.]GIX08806.1 MAG: alpha/beta hydrolase [Elioraea sp.]
MDGYDTIEGPNGRIAFVRHAGDGPVVVFLGGLRSDMTGTKATFLDGWCRARGRAFLRFDYTGHGASAGRFEDGTIGAWSADALAVLDRLTEGKVVLVGSSMGGWVMLNAALARPERVAALVGIAAAPDFTEDLLWERWDEGTRAALLADGVVTEPNPYDPAGYRYTRALIEDGRRHLRLRGPIPLACPARLLHGGRDEAVPWQTSLRLADRLAAADVQVTLVKDGDHRLSRTADLSLLGRTLGALLGEDGG